MTRQEPTALGLATKRHCLHRSRQQLARAAVLGPAAAGAIAAMIHDYVSFDVVLTWLCLMIVLCAVMGIFAISVLRHGPTLPASPRAALPDFAFRVLLGSGLAVSVFMVDAADEVSLTRVLLGLAMAHLSVAGAHSPPPFFVALAAPQMLAICLVLLSNADVQNLTLCLAAVVIFAALFHQHVVSSRSAREAIETQLSLEQTNRALDAALRNVEELTRRDELTGLYNRRHFDEVLASEIARTHRTLAPFSVALVDLDNFKALNDRYGHAAGDDALRVFASCVEARLRTADCLARYGGEEFALIMPGTTAEQAVSVVERLRLALKRTPFAAGVISITFSAGIAEFTRDIDGDDLLGRADAALYEAKTTGRDRVVLARSPIVV